MINNRKLNLPCLFWITGLPASGKTTLAQALYLSLLEREETVIVLDGDNLRQGLCSDLGLNEADRKENIRRAGEVARLLINNNITVICALISPYQKERDNIRNSIPKDQFAEIYLAPSLETCISRDPKGLYAKALEGKISGMTGIDAPYEAPIKPEFQFDTATISVPRMVNTILDHS
ncbi:adenylylsulfate kinase [Oceanospirillum multiglobuliferum]|uniref:Adenylyl-sulfate kinase n=1 Tax=Oceanospirillum multiglobuliferum TaxID=64969 RepID=A0A1T4LUW7_9GAMM|nr:adenylyl-sulfate kinase [Oceanospirillum multiglobuliferum]OPX56351.1 adenylyl-sulfate kinase [Oceanospirillum multiglobuliferum]SJZ58540.1 adenylylsulfate kinase [Oceanospirillum multiglobuliferum]